MDASLLISTVTDLVRLMNDLFQQQKTANAGAKPAPVAVREYEQVVYKFRDQRVPGEVKAVTQLLINSIDAFEAGRVLHAGREVMLALEQFQALGTDAVVTITPEQTSALGQFRTRLFKMIVPSPELKQKRMDI